MALPAPVDRGYLNLLAHLRKARSELPLETVQAAICHYLVQLPPVHPTPTPLIETVVASPLWHTLSWKSLLALGSTFRSAAGTKYNALQAEKRGFFQGSVSWDFNRWTRGILEGLKGGKSFICLAISGGLAMGLQDLTIGKIGSGLMDEVENQIVVSFAKSLDSSTVTQWSWAKEVRPGNDGLNDRACIAILLASQYLQAVSTEKLAALRLLNLVPICVSMITRAFHNAKFLDHASESLSISKSGLVEILHQSRLQQDITSVLSSDSFVYVAPICRFLARAIDIIIYSANNGRRRGEAWLILVEISEAIENMAKSIEATWRESLLARVSGEKDIDPNGSEMSAQLWTILKTLLFASLMVQQALLDAVLFLPESSSSRMSHGKVSINAPAALSIAKSILQTLSALSFVTTNFGGVTAGQSQKADGEGRSFPELKKVFYMAVDVLSTDAHQSEEFVEILTRQTGFSDEYASASGPFTRAKQAYALSCVEQLVPVLNDSCIESQVVPLCEPHLRDSSHRETFESAHSVMLSIFAAYADRSVILCRSYTESGSQSDHEYRSLAHQLVPGYARCLIENAKEDKLTTPQFRLAFSALVRSASCTRAYINTGPESSQPADLYEKGRAEVALAWLCIHELLEAIFSYSAKIGADGPDDNRSQGIHATPDRSESSIASERFKLSLALISLIPNVVFAMLPRVLLEVEAVVLVEKEKWRRLELVDSIFEEIMERLGDEGKRLAMQWWNKLTKDLLQSEEGSCD